MGGKEADPVLDRLRRLEGDLVELQRRIEALQPEELLERIRVLRADAAAADIALARAEFVAVCQGRESALAEPGDVVDLIRGLPCR